MIIGTELSAEVTYNCNLSLTVRPPYDEELQPNRLLNA